MAETSVTDLREHSVLTEILRQLARALSPDEQDTWTVTIEDTAVSEPAADTLSAAVRVAGEPHGTLVVEVSAQELDAALTSNADRNERSSGAECMQLWLGRAFAASNADAVQPGWKLEHAGERTEAVAGRVHGAVLNGAGGETLRLVLHLDEELVECIERRAHAVDQGREADESSPDAMNLDLVLDVELNVVLRFGQRQLTLREVLDLTSGSVIELDRQVEEPVELLLEGKIIARGEAVVVDGNYGLRVTEVPQPISHHLLPRA